MHVLKELDNGIKVIIEKIENINSISLGVIVENGSRNEEQINNGISHFIEHMLFRGTTNKTSKEIAGTIDNIGGNVNAFTSKENTCFYAQVLKQHLDITIGLLSDMFVNPLFNEEDIEKEKRVIEEEINMYLDDPEDLVHELLNELIYSNTSLELPILGSAESIKKFNNKSLKEYFNRYYNAKNIIISIVGNIDINEIYIKLNYNFGRINIGNKLKSKELYRNKNQPLNKINGINKEIEQFNLCIGLPGTSSASDNLYSYLILNNILVNNESSRFYQSIREAGFAYSIYSSVTSYADIGDMSIYMGLNNKNIETTLSLIDKEFCLSLSKDYISYEEIERGKQQLKINYILDNESSLSKMFENAKSISLFNRIETQEEVLSKIEKIDKEDIKNIIDKNFNREYMNISYISNIKNRRSIDKKINNKILRGE